MYGTAEVLGWSFPLLRVAGIPIRCSWLLLVWMLFDVVRFSQAHLPVLIAAAFVVPPLTMLIHAAGHALGARIGGGRLESTTLSVLNNQDTFVVPQRPWSHLWAGLGGMLANLLMYGLSLLVPLADAGSQVELVLAYLGGSCLLVALVNLLACQPFDGHRWWRGLLWAFMPMAKAVRTAVILGFISAILLLIFAVWRTDFLLLMMGVLSLMATIADRQQIAEGHDAVFLTDPTYGGKAPPSAWRKSWEARRQAREERAETAEQEVLDRLLAKVSAHGLPSLTAAERKQLQAISQRQKNRG